MKKYLKSILRNVVIVACLLACISFVCYGQVVPAGIVINVSTDHKDQLYKVKDPVVFTATVSQNGTVLKNIKLNYEVGPEKMLPVLKGTENLKDGSLKINGGTMEQPGFLRCVVTCEYEGKLYRGISTVGFDPDKIETTSITPTDFIHFWNNEKAMAAKIPLDAKMELLADKSNDVVNVYHVSFQNHQLGSRIYGILCVPKKEGKYPAVVRFPGAGVRAHNGNPAFASKGLITLEIGIHGIPVNMKGDVYDNLYKGALGGYPYFNLDSRNSYYFRRVFMGCVKSLDFIYSLPQFDGQNLAVAGSSQGGALSIVTTALDKRVKYLLAFCPAMCDLTGYLNGRAAGWPNMFTNSSKNLAATKDKITTSGYYDVANFAKLIQVPGIYSWGYNDEVTPPTSIYAAYNNIKAPKELFIFPEIAHVVSPDQSKMWFSWLESKLLKK